MKRYLMGLLFFIIPIFSYASSPLDLCSKRHCMVVIDAGSTASRLHLYAYDLNQQKMPIQITSLYTKKIKPGLANVINTKASIDAYLKQLMLENPNYSIPVYFYATAGMRLLPIEIQDHYYDLIQRWFSQNPKWSLKDARTISGKEEGVYGWLALNYYLQRLDEPNQSMVGLIEMGGASMQIAFPVQDPAGIDSNDLLSINIYGRPITLFTHSFLSLGANEIFAQFQQRRACFPYDYPLNNGDRAQGDAEICQQEIGEILDRDYHVKRTTLPALKKSMAEGWYTVASVSAMVNQEPFHFTDNEFSLEHLLYQADQKSCRENYQILSQRYVNHEYILRNCLIASYFYSLLLHGFDFEASQKVRYFSDYESSWTLGVLFHIR